MVNRPIEIDGVKYFKCRKCGEVKPLNKCYFHVNTMYMLGYNSVCKQCISKERSTLDTNKYRQPTRAELLEENKKLKGECKENDYLVEDNARWMKKCEEKTMEIKKLKSDLAYERTMLDNVRAEYDSLQNVIKKLRKRVIELEKEKEFLLEAHSVSAE